MPKIIDNIEEKISHTAFELFAEKGYKSVSMKIIAREVGISVGTLYNYFLNKQGLFVSVFEKNIAQTYFLLNRIIEKKGSTLEFVTTLYDEVERIQEFSSIIMGNKVDNEIFNEIRNHLLNKMKSLIYKVEEKENLKFSKIDEERIVHVLLLTIYDFTQNFPDEKEGNIAFTCNLVDKIKA